MSDKIGILSHNINPKCATLLSYDILIGMDWLENHWSLINYKDKENNFLSEEGMRQEIHGVRRTLKLRPIITS